jgi:hypothetical protein
MERQVGPIESSLDGLSEQNKVHRLRIARAEFTLLVGRMQSKPVTRNHAKVALRILAEDSGTSVKSFRRREQHKEAYRVWKDVYAQDVG